MYDTQFLATFLQPFTKNFLSYPIVHNLLLCLFSICILIIYCKFVEFRIILRKYLNQTISDNIL